MKSPEGEQLLLEDAPMEQDKEPPKGESSSASRSAFERDGEDCPVCGGSGPCSACPRGRALAKQQGRPYRRSRN